jgi:hypothetical protein
MSGLATVKYAPVSTVTKHGLSMTQPWVTRLGSAISVMTVNVWWEGVSAYAGVRPSLPALIHFPASGHPYCAFLRRLSAAILSFLVNPAYL